LISDQPMIYIFSSPAPLPAGTVIASLQTGTVVAGFDPVTLDAPAWLMSLEPSPYEDAPHPVTYYLVDTELENVTALPAVAPPAVDGTFFIDNEPQPVLSVFFPLLGNMEPEAQAAAPALVSARPRGVKYEFVVYFEGEYASYGHCAVGYNKYVNGTLVAQAIYDNVPSNVAPGHGNTSIGWYKSIHEYKIQVWGEGGLGLSSIGIPATEAQVDSLKSYFAQHYLPDAFCDTNDCLSDPYNLFVDNCADFVKGAFTKIMVSGKRRRKASIHRMDGMSRRFWISLRRSSEPWS